MIRGAAFLAFASILVSSFLFGFLASFCSYFGSKLRGSCFYCVAWSAATSKLLRRKQFRSLTDIVPPVEIIVKPIRSFKTIF